MPPVTGASPTDAQLAGVLPTDGYESGGTTTDEGPRRAFIATEDDDGLSRRLAFGECRSEDGLFVIESVMEGGEEFDVLGQTLGEMSGGLLALEDLDEVDLDLEWADEPEQVNTEMASCSAATADAAQQKRLSLPGHRLRVGS